MIPVLLEGLNEIIPPSDLLQCTMTMLPTLALSRVLSSKRWQQHSCLWKAAPMWN